MLIYSNVFYKSRRELDNLCGRDETAHQGLVAEVEQLEEITLKEFIIENKKQNLNLIALEDVTDPRNIGSIIRSAVAFKIDGIIVKERSFPSKSKLLHKSASGGTEHIKIFKVSNINTSLKYLKSKEFWVSAFDVSGTKDFTKNNWKGKNVLVTGINGFIGGNLTKLLIEKGANVFGLIRNIDKNRIETNRMQLA